MATLKKNKFEVTSLKDISVKYSETCDIDHIHIADIGDVEYTVSARYETGDKEADILILNDEDDIIVGYAPVAKNMCKNLKLVLLSYLVGNNKISIKRNK